MFRESISEVLFVNVEFGAGCPTAQGPSTLRSLTPEEKVRLFLEEITQEAGIATSYVAPDTRKSLFQVMEEKMRPGTFIVSTDNAVSYAIFHALSSRGETLRSNIIFDQHMDIYSYRTHGRDLTKANPYRMALDQKIISRVIFVGARLLEEAFRNPYILTGMPRYLLDFPYAWFRYNQGQHAGLDQYIDVLPASLSQDFQAAADEAIRLVENYDLAELMRGSTSTSYSFGFEIDLDVFNSQEISGVDYGVHLPSRLLDNARAQFLDTGTLSKPFSFLQFLYNCWVLSYVKHKIECPGIHVPDENAMRKVFRRLAASPIPCSFVHVTELKLEHDDNARNTSSLVRSLIKAAVVESRRSNAKTAIR